MFEKYLDYLDKSGGVTAEEFDDDWEPIGPMLRSNPDFIALVQINEVDKRMRRK